MIEREDKIRRWWSGLTSQRRREVQDLGQDAVQPWLYRSLYEADLAVPLRLHARPSSRTDALPLDIRQFAADQP